MDSDTSKLTFILDGERITLNNVSPQTRLIDYLHRPVVGKGGTKLVCGQSGCGACTVTLTSYDLAQQKIFNRAINACLRPLAGLDGTMITTIRGIGNVKDGVDEVQWKIAASNGSQCGYCTPGFTMNMFTLRQNKKHLTEKEIEDHFDGNICRCTGYRPILEAFKQFADDYKPPHPEPRIVIDPNYKPCVKPFKEIHPPVDFVEYMQNPKPLLFSRDGYTYERPVSLEALYEIKKEHGPTGPKFRLVCGNTSVGIYETHSIYAEEALDPHYLVDISAIPELQKDDDEGLTLGGAVTLSRLLKVLDEVIAARDSVQTRGLSAMREHARVVANHQIRNEASLAGNVHIATNLGFLSDMVLVLATLGACRPSRAAKSMRSWSSPPTMNYQKTQSTNRSGYPIPRSASMCARSRSGGATRTAMQSSMPASGSASMPRCGWQTAGSSTTASRPTTNLNRPPMA